MSTPLSVAIVGGGPNGIALANLLGAYGVRTVVVEREREILEYPRAVGMDDEALRLLQTVQLAEPLLQHMIPNVPLRMFRADGRCFADIRASTREFGWWRRNIFMQQLAEKTLRQGLQRYPHVELRLGQEVIGCTQSTNGVTLQVRNAQGETYPLHCDYAVAADGGRSPMREMLGVKLLGRTHAIKWLVVDVRNAPIDAPYTALNCDPRRPNVCIYLPYGYRRWEFMVFADEDEQAIAAPESVRRLLAPFVADPTAVEIVRARTYTHHSRVADRFVVGRVALIGDAAHLSPPWIGQGLNAGLRDVGNLAWKLAGIVNGQFQPAVLETYQQERHRHAQAMIDLADVFGAMLMPTHRLKAWCRDRFFSLARLLPGVKDYVLQMRFKPMPRYEQGVVVHQAGRPMVGRMLIQPDVEDDRGLRRKLDDVIGPWFAVIGWQTDPQASLSETERAFWHRLGAHFIRLDRARSGSAPGARIRSAHGSTCLEDVDNQFSDWICAHPGEVLVLRPDRYIAAQCTAAEWPAVARQFHDFTCEPRRDERAAA
ncbi:bifunctional 3-(3-hydroxy-phenyl)propionate/3-hydroxycinnamic acid hydroxylase [Pelomonas cellulosilytica]|uniref:Bifunctional 3-(3-hydroxy-phenyl)propionate/3-hydroxycinnamic acid hydroxylase n=1 Tax=Pelomonas cellulosilytica TaxID=2906762 RepID=A0ABS8XQH0_9BURK|nr:bifunctional 3-(3-hydroxy-phenyl)propionate/3-hydroxycinnamic acid hydroxylase [Pelomonas sp. P8]MCE4554996.1 bifunctional 3-(3-hydroxy-phenyl)propionate/3-hydroxycinnamic acid hydroxylase [Pelomonas sp. P8]